MALTEIVSIINVSKENLIYRDAEHLRVHKQSSKAVKFEDASHALLQDASYCYRRSSVLGRLSYAQ